MCRLKQHFSSLLSCKQTGELWSRSVFLRNTDLLHFLGDRGRLLSGLGMWWGVEARVGVGRSFSPGSGVASEGGSLTCSTSPGQESPVWSQACSHRHLSPEGGMRGCKKQGRSQIFRRFAWMNSRIVFGWMIEFKEKVQGKKRLREFSSDRK